MVIVPQEQSLSSAPMLYREEDPFVAVTLPPEMVMLPQVPSVLLPMAGPYLLLAVTVPPVIAMPPHLVLQEPIPDAWPQLSA